MRDWLRNLLSNTAVFIVVNTIFWVGLGAVLLTDPFRMFIGAILLAFALGGYMLYSAISPAITRGMVEPDQVRIVSAFLGLGALVFASVMLVYVLRGGVRPRKLTRQQRVQARIADAYDQSWLDLSDLGLREVPPVVWYLDHITELDLSKNRLRSLPPDIANMTQLETLYLWHNRLESVPPEIGALSNLERLDLATNRLETLPPELARLQNLKALQLQHNRLTKFPEEILELPNLELLFLSGNPMGELPPSIIQRAEAGDLNLSYRPHASRVDFFSIFVILFTFVSPVLLSAFVHRWWATWELTQRQAARQEGTVFPIPPFLRSQTLFGVFGLSAISLLMLVAGFGEDTGIDLTSSIIVTLMFLPIILGGIAFTLHHTGLIVLTAEGVIARRPGRERFVRYGDIREIRTPKVPFTPALVIVGDAHTLRIPRTLENRHRFHEMLRARVASPIGEAMLGRAAAPTATAGRPAEAEGVYTLNIRRRMWALYIAGTVLLILVYLGIGLLGLWMGLIQGDIPPLTQDWLTSTLIFFALISVLFLPAIIIVIRGLLTRYGPFNMDQPVAWAFYPDKIRYRLPRGRWQERPAQDLQRVHVDPVPATVRGGRGVRQQVMLYMVVLDFAGDTQLVINQERAAQFGTSPQQIHDVLSELYGRG